MYLKNPSSPRLHVRLSNKSLFRRTGSGVRSSLRPIEKSMIVMTSITTALETPTVRQKTRLATRRNHLSAKELRKRLRAPRTKTKNAANSKDVNVMDVSCQSRAR